MGVVYDHQGKLEEALLGYEKALGIIKSALGGEHADVGRMYLRMAIVYGQQGRLEEDMNELKRRAQKLRGAYAKARERQDSAMGASPSEGGGRGTSSDIVRLLQSRGARGGPGQPGGAAQLPTIPNASRPPSGVGNATHQSASDDIQATLRRRRQSVQEGQDIIRNARKLMAQ